MKMARAKSLSEVKKTRPVQKCIFYRKKIRGRPGYHKSLCGRIAKLKRYDAAADYFVCNKCIKILDTNQMIFTSEIIWFLPSVREK